MRSFENLLAGGDLRSIGKSNSVVKLIASQSGFDELFEMLFHPNRIIAMRAADAVEKITVGNPEYLVKHKRRILKLLGSAENKELMWHLALLIPRLQLNKNELSKVWSTLAKWLKDKTNSRIVRVNSLQGLFEIAKKNPAMMKKFILLLNSISAENVPSLNARVRMIRKQLSQ